MTDFADDLIALIQPPSVRADVVRLYAVAILYEAFARPPQAKTLAAIREMTSELRILGTYPQAADGPSDARV